MQVLVTLEFTSSRRRQSVIIRDEYGIKLYMKGADVAVFERLHASQAEAQAVQEGFLDTWSQQVPHCSSLKHAVLSRFLLFSSLFLALVLMAWTGLPHACHGMEAYCQRRIRCVVGEVP